MKIVSSLPNEIVGGRDRMVVGFTTTYEISAYHHLSYEFELSAGEVYSIQYMWTSLSAVGGWFSQGTPVSSTNKTDLHDIARILLKVALNIIKPNQTKWNCQ